MNDYYDRKHEHRSEINPLFALACGVAIAWTLIVGGVVAGLRMFPAGQCTPAHAKQAPATNSTIPTTTPWMTV